MIGAVLGRLGEAWLACALVQAALWAIARRTRNAGIVDVGWALTFSLVTTIFAIQSTSPPGGWLPIALLVMIWSGRLGIYLISRGAATGHEEGRYVTLRRKWQPTPDRAFFVFFQAQAALTALLSIAFVVPFLASPWDGGWLRTLGLLFGFVGIAGEAIADEQLATWRRSPENKGLVCDVGLWAYSRHPNYFFEWCVWLGYALYGLAFHGGWIALFGQALILASIWKVTGIPATETQALRTKGDFYRAYQRSTSVFIPLPRRRRAPSVAADIEDTVDNSGRGA